MQSGGARLFQDLGKRYGAPGEPGNSSELTLGKVPQAVSTPSIIEQATATVTEAKTTEAVAEVLFTFGEMTFRYNPMQRLGRSGGFGSVYAGHNALDREVAVKVIDQPRAFSSARRELEVAKEFRKRDFKHVMPILASGTFKNMYYLVMPRAEKNLQDHLDKNGKLTEAESMDILLAIASGLEEVSGIIHRDLKPANILFHNSDWKVSDFGSARLLDNEPSTLTVRDHFTPAFAAPEQLSGQEATAATDIYALACIGYTLLTGSPPFGIQREVAIAGHLQKDPELLLSISPSLSRLLVRMLSKKSDSRPTLSEVIQLMRELINPDRKPGKGGEALARIGQAIYQAVAEKEREEKVQKDVERTRQELQIEGISSLQCIIKKLLEDVKTHIPAAMVDSNEKDASVVINDCRLRFQLLPNPPSQQDSPYLDILAMAQLQVNQSSPQHVWSASLFFADVKANGDLRWYEISFYHEDPSAKNQPFGYDKPGTIAKRIGKEARIAYGPKPIDREFCDDFVDRWELLLAKALNGTLARPAVLPLSANFFNED